MAGTYLAVSCVTSAITRSQVVSFNTSENVTLSSGNVDDTILLVGATDNLAGVFTMNGPYTTRESLFPFSLHGMQVNEVVRDESTVTRSRDELKQRHRLIAAMIFALLLGLVDELGQFGKKLEGFLDFGIGAGFDLVARRQTKN